MCWIFLRAQVLSRYALRRSLQRARPQDFRSRQSMPILALTLLSVALSAAAQIALKLGVSDAHLQGLLATGRYPSFLLHAVATPWVAAGVLMYVLSAVTWLFVLARTDLSFAYPFVSLAFVVTAVYGSWALNEPMGLARVGGVGLIVGGVLLVARS
jgi:drug/metabolite transporter (DMT)-like permease